jgi:DNA repair protein RecO (recombination protein O)
MHWSDHALVLGTRLHGETGAVLEVLTRQHGRHLGLIRGGKSRRMRPILQTGNSVAVEWRARLDEHLGVFTVEPVAMRAGALIESRLAVNGVQLFASLMRLLPERDPHERLFVAGEVVLDAIADPAVCGELMVRLELEVLNDLGFRLDLERCAATGGVEDLVYVSPKTGRAVSRDAGAAYHDRLLDLPRFLVERAAAGRPDPEALRAAYRLTGHFLQKNVFEPRGLAVPAARGGFLQALERLLAHPGEPPAA